VGIFNIFYLYNYKLIEAFAETFVCCLTFRNDEALFTLQRDTAYRDYGVYSFEYDVFNMCS